jgi:hypothetical protein
VLALASAQIRCYTGDSAFCSEPAGTEGHAIDERGVEQPERVTERMDGHGPFSAVLFHGAAGLTDDAKVMSDVGSEAGRIIVEVRGAAN